MKSKQIRSSFIDFFEKKDHHFVRSSPVVPIQDKTLLFTNAGMNQFKPIFLGDESPEHPRAVNSQKCIRVSGKHNDLEVVGLDGFHHTFFEMLGNWSFGDYYKAEAIEWAWELLTNVWGLDKNRLWATVYNDDEESFNLWPDVTDISKDRVLKFGDKENYWEMGETGPCGPCSEIHYYVGDDLNNQSAKGVNRSDDYWELWNLVFIQSNRDVHGKLNDLAQIHIDTGAGLERIVSVIQGKTNNYETDLFSPIIQSIEKLTSLKSEDNPSPFHVISDHIRMLCFSIADGALPSNVGGGYNLRMMLRRINGTINQLNLKLDIDELIDAHIDYLKDTYPELDEKREDVKTILKLESSRYEESKIHMKKKAEKIREKGAPSVDELITLYESDGITPEYLKEIDAISEIPSQFYSKLSDLHQSEKKKAITELPLEELPETETLFYKDDPMEFEAKVIKVLGDQVVLDRTSFYARGGGQEPDLGTISEFNVVNVDKHANIIVHKLEGGVPKEGDTVSCKVDETRRANITKNHTSTHIINVSSRGVLGSWIWQHSAFKDDDHARLDITHHSSLTDEQVKQIEDAANQMVKENYPVNIDYYDRGTAEQKYGFKIYQGGVVPVKSVRIVSIEDKDIEACGGTHVKKTGDIELIKITKTKRIQDGVVRIEFVSGPTAFQYVKDQEEESKKQAANDTAKEKLEKLREENKEKSREIRTRIARRKSR